MARYTTIYRGSERHVIESDRLDRFLEEGWTTEKTTVKKLKSKKKLLPKVEIKAKAEVNHKTPDVIDSEEDMSDIEWEINNLKEETNDGNTNR
jgi:hypothetical protein|tara:strand:- start:2432 stop:2710 length:279 start_codon:yes stop_codon:yes gene_type:complete